MTKNDIVDRLHEKLGFPKKEAADILDSIFDSIKASLSDNRPVKISNFGNFVLKDKNSRVGRNPKTGEEIEIPARTVVTFKPSSKLKETINGKSRD